jgi:hypothetical protein
MEVLQILLVAAEKLPSTDIFSEWSLLSSFLFIKKVF